MTCPTCKLQLDVPSEVENGLVIGVCSGCGTLIGPAAPKIKPLDTRGRPSKPGRAAA